MLLSASQPLVDADFPAIFSVDVLIHSLDGDFDSIFSVCEGASGSRRGFSYDFQRQRGVKCC